MLMEVKKHLVLLKKFFFFNLKCSIAYRTSFIIQIISMIINNFSILFFWWIIFSNVKTIGGYSFSNIIILWGLSSSIFGIINILFGNLSNLSQIIINGSLDSYMLQPKDIVINVCSSKTVISAWGDLLYGYILLIISGSLTLLNLFLFTLFTIVGGIIFFACTLTVNSLALYLGNIENSKQIFNMFFVTFSTYPEGIFEKYIRIFFYSFIPVGFMVYIPVKIMSKFSLFNTILVILSSIFYLTVSYIIFYRGLKRYESGNLIENKF